MSAPFLPVPNLLRQALLADAAFSAPAGLVLAVAAAPLATLLSLPQPLLFWAGLFCIGYGAALFALGRTPRLARSLVLGIVVGNLLWVAASLALAFGPWLAPNAWGIAFLLLQAAIVAVLAECQWLGLRRAGPAPAARDVGADVAADAH